MPFDGSKSYRIKTCVSTIQKLENLRNTTYIYICTIQMHTWLKWPKIVHLPKYTFKEEFSKESKLWTGSSNWQEISWFIHDLDDFFTVLTKCEMRVCIFYELDHTCRRPYYWLLNESLLYWCTVLQGRQFMALKEF